MVNGVVSLPQPSISSPPTAMPPFGVGEIRKRTHAIQEVMKGVMKEGTHFGTIPGTPKPSLWKAGAEVLCMTFRLTPLLESRVTVDDPEAEWTYTATRREGIVTGTCVGYFEVEATCTIQGPTGEVLSRCSARCNSREAKYRTLSQFDIRNTVLKMAEKRALVASVLLSTGCSDIFAQDLEDLLELVDPVVPQPVLPADPIPSAPTITGKPTTSLTPRREAWLFRAAKEACVPQDVLDRCLDHLRSAAPDEVRVFFDELARKKRVFEPFLAAAS